MIAATAESPAALADREAQRLHVGADQLRGHRGRGGSEIGHQIGQGGVRLMANGADDRDSGGKNGAGDRLIAENGQLVGGATAAGQDDHVDRQILLAGRQPTWRRAR